ncbi:hypothetical protein RAS2_02660 [Phycisphaerae bacterium RAS2]|nr:hypothetical protein RAS2_02660 [Phycisphaerae bacterium RAS2]
MVITAAQRDLVDSFRSSFEDAFARDDRFKAPARHDRPDGSTLAVRWPTAANEHVWLEIAVRPLIPQVRVGILTDDRWKSEDFEEKIEESGDTMSEFVEMGFEEAGLTWLDPPVEHYREDRTFFYFATAVELPRLDDLAMPAVREKARQMFEGYFHAFGPYLE